MTPSYAVSAADLQAIWPELWLLAVGCFVLLLEAFAPAWRRLYTPLALIGTLGAMWLTLTARSPVTCFSGLLETSGVTIAASFVVLLAASLALLASDGYLRRENINFGEYHALLLWCCVGMLLMLRATELLTVFIGLELLSICLYALAGFNRRVPVATEAAIKYFLMGAFVSAFVLLGAALLYGETGSTQFQGIASAMRAGTGSGPLEALGILLLIAGFGFKMSLIPFHAWSPDTYQGAPTPFVAFLSVAPKAASAIVLIRVLQTGDAIALVTGKWSGIVALLAVVSMLGGNLLALAQRDLKRMLAYSGIAHMGYLLIPLAHLDAESWIPVLVYLLAYALMNAGAFALVSILYDEPGKQHLISNLAGWGYRYPLLSVCLSICMLSLGGIPPTLGFLAKYLIFVHALQSGQIFLAVVGVSASLIGVFYYLRVVYVLYMKDEVKAATPRNDVWGRVAAIAAAGASLVLGIWPSGMLDWLSSLLLKR